MFDFTGWDVIYLFTSDATIRYLTDALEAICYPADHVIRFRYQEKYISRIILGWDVRPNGDVIFPEDSNRQALIVYADSKTANENNRFRFFPLRSARIIKITRSGSICLVDIQLKTFVSYLPNPTISDPLSYSQRLFEKLKFHPLPTRGSKHSPEGFFWNDQGVLMPASSAAVSNRGHFLNHSNDQIGHDEETGDEELEGKAWESVVNALWMDTSLSGAIFFRVAGIYSLKRRAFNRYGQSERKILPSCLGVETRYTLPMGGLAMLRVIVYQPEEPNQTKLIKVEAKGDAIAGLSPAFVRVDSRYNEQRVIVACKRVFDHVLSVISLTRENEQTTMAEPVFLTQVEFPWVAFLIILFGLTVTPLLLSLTTDSFQFAAEIGMIKSNWPDVSRFGSDHARGLAASCKPLAAAVTLVAGFLGFRKLPLGK